MIKEGYEDLLIGNLLQFEEIVDIYEHYVRLDYVSMLRVDYKYVMTFV